MTRTLAELIDEGIAELRTAGVPITHIPDVAAHEHRVRCLACGSKWVRFEYHNDGGWQWSDPIFTRKVWCWECGHYRDQVWSPDVIGPDSPLGLGNWIEDGGRSDEKATA